MYLAVCMPASMCVSVCLTVSAYVVCAGGAAVLPDAAGWSDLTADTARNLPSARRRGMDGSDVGVERCVPRRLPMLLCMKPS